MGVGIIDANFYEIFNVGVTLVYRNANTCVFTTLFHVNRYHFYDHAVNIVALTHTQGDSRRAAGTELHNLQ